MRKPWTFPAASVAAPARQPAQQHGREVEVLDAGDHGDHGGEDREIRDEALGAELAEVRGEDGLSRDANDHLLPEGAIVNELAEVRSHTDPSAPFGIAVGWSEHDPGGAIEWALGAIGDPDKIHEMVGGITFNWSNRDPRGATRWLDVQPPGKKTDRVLKAFSGMVLEEDPEAAVVRATRISDPAARDAHVRGSPMVSSASTASPPAGPSRVSNCPTR